MKPRWWLWVDLTLEMLVVRCWWPVRAWWCARQGHPLTRSGHYPGDYGTVHWAACWCGEQSEVSE